MRSVVKVAQQMGLEYNSIPVDGILHRDARIEAQSPPEDDTRKNLNTSSFRYLSKKLAQRISTETSCSLSHDLNSQERLTWMKLMLLIYLRLLSLNYWLI
jgi:hypothetical protein